MTRTFLFILFIQLSSLSSAQNQEILGLISNVEARVLYRGYDNNLELFSCADCDSVFVSSLSAKVQMLNSLQFVVTPKTGSRTLVLRVNCIKGIDTTVLWSEPYSVKSMPYPKVYLGGIDLEKDINIVKEVNLFSQNRFLVRYDENVQLTGVKFRVTEWLIRIGNETFTNKNAKLTAEFKAAFQKARKGKKIYFDYVNIIAPDGITRRINIDQVYRKKSKRNTEYDPAELQRPWLSPECGG